MACDALVFEGFTRERFNLIEQKVAEFGFRLPGDSGQESQKGFTLRWDFDEAAGTLTLQCLASPFFMPCSMVNEKLRQAVGSVR